MKALDGKKFLHGSLVGSPSSGPLFVAWFCLPLLPFCPSLPFSVPLFFGAPLGLSGPARLLKILPVPPSGYLVVP